MLRKIIFLLFGVALGLPLKSVGQDRNVLWIHGYNGDNTTWGDMAAHYAGSSPNQGTHKMVYFNPPTYNTVEGTDNFIGQIKNQNTGNFTNRLITIAHSFGGVAARHIDLNDATDKLGGLITVGSPLSGAGIATSINNGALADEGQNALRQLERGPTAQFFPVLIALPLRFIVNALVDNVIVKKATPNPSTRDMAYGSPFITGDMNASSTVTPKVSIYGVENSPVHWNFIGSSTGRNAVAIADDAEDDYYTSFVVNIVAGSVHTILGFWNPDLWWDAILEFWRANEWKVGYDWLHDSERIWNIIIGANIIAGHQCYTYTAFVCSYSNNANFTNPSCWQQVTTCYIPQLNGKSDGFIPAVSQTGVGANSWTGATLIKAEGINHSNEHDAGNKTMTDIFDGIFDGTISTHPYFFTNRK